MLFGSEGGKLTNIASTVVLPSKTKYVLQLMMLNLNFSRRVILRPRLPGPRPVFNNNRTKFNFV